MKILGIIPARSGSKGVPGKNMKFLGGQALIDYTIDVALSSRHLATVMVSTEDQATANHAISKGVEVPFLRPEELAADDTSSMAVVQHVLNEYENLGAHYDAVCLLQPTTPFRSLDLLERGIKSFIEGGYSGLVSVLEVPHQFHPNWTFQMDVNGHLKNSLAQKMPTRRQELPATYYRDGSLYLTKSEVIREQDSFFGNQLGCIHNTDPVHVNIDTQEDWRKAEQILVNSKLS